MTSTLRSANASASSSSRPDAPVHSPAGPPSPTTPTPIAPPSAVERIRRICVDKNKLRLIQSDEEKTTHPQMTQINADKIIFNKHHYLLNFLICVNLRHLRTSYLLLISHRNHGVPG